MRKQRGGVAKVMVSEVAVFCPRCDEEIYCNPEAVAAGEDGVRPSECDALHGKAKCSNGHMFLVPDTTLIVGRPTLVKAPFRAVKSLERKLGVLVCGHTFEISTRTKARIGEQRRCHWCLIGARSHRG